MEAFISYRSPSYTQLKENNCKLLNGEICNKQTAPNCHFRGCSFRRASIFANRQDFIVILENFCYCLIQRALGELPIF